jgi:hypothetical protein
VSTLHAARPVPPPQPRRFPVPRRSARPVPVRGPARLLRGWAAAVVATVLAAGSHTVASAWGSGQTHAEAGPAPVVWILTLALAGPLCTVLAGRALSWFRLVLGVGTSQLLFHWLYSMAVVPAAFPASAESASGTSLPGPHAGSGHAAAPVLSRVPGTAESLVATGTPGVADQLPHLSPAMLAAHVLAAVGTVFLLRRGEVLAVRVAELAAGMVLRTPGARLARWRPSSAARRLAVRAAAPAWFLDEVLLSVVRLRGPPVGVLAG